MCCVSLFFLSSGGVIVGREIAIILTGYSSPITALLAASLFILLNEAKFARSDRLWRLDRLCFGTYLLHPVFTNLFYKFIKVTPLAFERFVIVGVLCFFMIFTILGFTASWIMSRIPLLRKYVL